MVDQGPVQVIEHENSQSTEFICWAVCVLHFFVMILMLVLLRHSVEEYTDIKDTKVNRLRLGLINDDDNNIYMFYIIYHGFWFILYFITFVYVVLNFHLISNMKYICCICIMILFGICIYIARETDINARSLEICWCILLLILSCVYLYDYCVVIYKIYVY